MKLENALLVQPLSAAKMSGKLSPDAVLSRLFGDISQWVHKPTNDVAIVFTSGLYQNNDTQEPRQQRMSLLQREGEWRIRFGKLLRQNSERSINGFPLMAKGFRMATWDEQITENWGKFSAHLEKLRKAFSRDVVFRSFIESEILKMNRLPMEGNISFVLEEIAVTALWLEGKIVVSKGLRETDKLDALHMVYPSSLASFMDRGLQFLLKDKKGCLPLIWLDTSDSRRTIATEHRFGRDRPSCFM